MIRNSGKISGIKYVPTLSVASGVHDTFDAYNYNKLGIWPIPPKITSCSFNSGVWLENLTRSLIFSGEGWLTNTTLWWTPDHISTTNADFVGIYGSFTVAAATQSGGPVITTRIIGLPSKPDRTFRLNIRTGSSNGEIIYTTGIYTIPTITLSNFYFSPTSISEGATTTLLTTFGNVGNIDATVTFQYSGTATTTADWTSLPTSTLVKQGGGTNSITDSIILTSIADLTTEGNETLTASLYLNSNYWGQTTVTLNDTSVNPTGTIVPSTTSVTEGESVTFNCTISDNFTGTAYYSISATLGALNAADFTDGLLSGSISFTNGVGSFIKTLVGGDGAETESFVAQLRKTSTTGTIINTSSTVTVNDAAAASVDITLTTCGSTGPTGPTPTQFANTYSSNPLYSNLSEYFGYQSFVIPSTGSYEFTVKGSAGGVWTTSPMTGTLAASCPTLDGYTRLPGATVTGIYTLNQGDVVTVVVGQRGGDDNNTVANCPGGGGGTFVTLGNITAIQNNTDTLLFAAGGGGGAGYQQSDAAQESFTAGIGQSTPSGGSCPGGEAGGTSGNGAPSSQSSGNSSGGGGYLAGPGSNVTVRFGDIITNYRASGFRQGAQGGTFTAGQRGYGGFGCGGHGAATTSSDDDKGGGGGYSGGGYAFDASRHGGGGGSFVNASATSTTISPGGNTTDADGSVRIRKI